MRVPWWKHGRINESLQTTQSILSLLSNLHPSITAANFFWAKARKWIETEDPRRLPRICHQSPTKPRMFDKTRNQTISLQHRSKPCRAIFENYLPLVQRCGAWWLRINERWSRSGFSLQNPVFLDTLRVGDEQAWSFLLPRKRRWTWLSRCQLDISDLLPGFGSSLLLEGLHVGTKTGKQLMSTSIYNGL
jgi:hypothetical protein